MATNSTSIIESLGVYLPPKSVSTEEVLRGCHKKIVLPLEQLTGIKYRRVAGVDEFSIDLAQKAIEDCLANSKYQPIDIDLLISCNISRYDGPNRFSFEPNTSIKLKKYFGFDKAIALDITNACAGMFTGIAIIDAFINAGFIQRGMVVSGEYITHLTRTAQIEIESTLDQRLACLTLGDAGAALILEKSPDSQIGFHNIDLYTLGRYSNLCIAKVTEEHHGGAIMHTDMLQLSFITTNQMIAHYQHILKQSGWTPGEINHLVMHQTSRNSLNGGIREFNKRFKEEIYHKRNTIDNLTDRGNTATTSHFVAIMDHILNNRIKNGDKVCFCIFASGLTIGTAFYTFDDLPDRIRHAKSIGGEPWKQRIWLTHTRERDNLSQLRFGDQNLDSRRVCIESVGIANPDAERDTFQMAKQAAEDCFGKSEYNRKDIELLIFAGIYRNHFISEPAIAALIAGQLKINDTINSQEDRKTFAFDVFSSGISFLKACYVASTLIQAGKFKTAMVVASEIENNAQFRPERLLGIAETGAGVILKEDALGEMGFGNFIFRYSAEAIEAFESHGCPEKGGYLEFYKAPNLEDLYIDCASDAVLELLEVEQLHLDQVKVVLPPQISSHFITQLSERLGISTHQFVDVSTKGKDIFTSSLPYGFHYLRNHNLVSQGDIALIINVGAGVQVGCVTYYF
jgi:3-oxoacyl-[acyl-carrier-protein] synthase III